MLAYQRQTEILRLEYYNMTIAEKTETVCLSINIIYQSFYLPTWDADFNC